MIEDADALKKEQAVLVIVSRTLSSDFGKIFRPFSCQHTSIYYTKVYLFVKVAVPGSE